MRNLPITASASVTLSGSSGTGSGTVSAGPKFAGEIWYPQSVSISCTGAQPVPAAPNIAQCNFYVGTAANSAAFIDGSFDPLGDSSSMITGKVLYPGQLVIAVWTNCNGGQVATLTVNGTRTVP